MSKLPNGHHLALSKTDSPGASMTERSVCLSLELSQQHMYGHKDTCSSRSASSLDSVLS